MNFTKQPASLKYLSSMKLITLQDQDFFNFGEVSREFILEQAYVNGYDFHMLHQDMNCIGFVLSIFDEDVRDEYEYKDLNCEYYENLFDAVIESEFDKIWPHMVLKYVTYYPCSLNWRGMPTIPTIYVSKHFWYELYRTGFLNKLYHCGSWTDILLLLSGDIETNPGPVETYKDLCRRKNIRKRKSRTREEIKMQQHIDRVIRQENEEYKIKDVNMQGMFSFNEEKEIIKSTAWKFNNTLDKTNSIMDNLIPQLEETLAGFRRTYSKCESKIFGTISVVDVCVDLISALLQVSFAKPAMKIASLAVEVFRLIKKYVSNININIDKIKELLSYGKVALNNNNPIIHVTMQSNSPVFEVLLQPNIIVSAIFIALSVVFTKNLPTKTGIEAMIKRLGDLGRAAKGCSDLNVVLNQAITTMLDHFGKNVLGLKQEDELKILIEGYRNWCDEVRDLVGHKINSDGELDSKSIVENIMKDVYEIQRVENMYKKGLEISRNIAELKLPAKLTISFNTHMRYLTEVFKSVDTSGAFGNKPRTQPIVIWLFGESGRGKSGMTWPLAIDLNNSLLDNVDEMRNFSKNIYMRNVEQEFWDNYQGQNIVCYDDFGQMRDSSSKPNPEFMELIRTANIAPYPLHMAHLEDKEKRNLHQK